MYIVSRNGNIHYKWERMFVYNYDDHYNADTYLLHTTSILFFSHIMYRQRVIYNGTISNTPYSDNLIIVAFSYIYTDSPQTCDNMYTVHILWWASVYIVWFRNFSTFFLFLSLWKCETNKKQEMLYTIRWNW